jgi:hypothetical protein
LQRFPVGLSGRKLEIKIQNSGKLVRIDDTKLEIIKMSMSFSAIEVERSSRKAKEYSTRLNPITYL